MLLKNKSNNTIMSLGKIFQKTINDVGYKKKYLESFFSYSLEQMITSPTRSSDRTAAHNYNLLKNSSHKVSQSRTKNFHVRKKLQPKSDNRNKTMKHHFVRWLKHYTKENFKETLKENSFSRLLKIYLHKCYMFRVIVILLSNEIIKKLVWLKMMHKTLLNLTKTRIFPNNSAAN